MLRHIYIKLYKEFTLQNFNYRINSKKDNVQYLKNLKVRPAWKKYKELKIINLSNDWKGRKKKRKLTILEVYKTYRNSSVDHIWTGNEFYNKYG